jgi:hypothetical protein
MQQLKKVDAKTGRLNLENEAVRRGVAQTRTADGAFCCLRLPCDELTQHTESAESLRPEPNSFTGRDTHGKSTIDPSAALSSDPGRTFGGQVSGL